jgi:tRNA threonylcarbamoyladenosine biosynthesis protein TsaB
LAETIHQKIKEILDEHEKSLSGIEGVVVFKGPGSFTGLRIGISVANALADGLDAPITGEEGEQWATQGIKRLLDRQNDRVVLPEYGAAPHITKPKH